jgi:hypothetical protein
MSFLRQLVDEINAVRTNPAAYASKVEGYIPYFQDKILKLPDQRVAIKTQEGAAAYEECVNFLKSAEPTAAHVPSRGLTRIANDFLSGVQSVDPSQIGTIDMNSIIDKYGAFQGNFSRAMEFGGNTPEQVVINLLVSDGDKTRSQRDALLNPILKRIGVSQGKHDIYRIVTIIVSCTVFQNNVDSDDTENYDGTELPPAGPKVVPQPEPVQQPIPAQTMAPPRQEYYSPPQPEPIQAQPEPQPIQAQPEPEPMPVQSQPGLTMLKDKIVEQENPNEGGDDNIVNVDRSERIVNDGGKKKKKITLTKHYKDGHTEKEVKFEPL